MAPVAAVVLGWGTASFLLGFTGYRPVFLGISFVLIGTGAFFMARRHRTCCSVEQQRRSLWAYLGTSIVAFVLSYGVLTYVVPSMTYRAAGEATAPVSTAGQGEILANSGADRIYSQGLRQAILEIRGMT